MHAKNRINGVGIGLRMPHYTDVLANAEKIGWIELLADNWLYDSKAIQARLLPLIEEFPITLHGVGLSIGSTKPIDWQYLHRIKSLMTTCNSHWYSEHLSLSWVGDEFVPDLLPITYNEASLNHIQSKIHQVQDFLQRPLLIENVSSYTQHKTDTLGEAEFLRELCRHTGCYLLLDVNNLYVNQFNLNRNAQTALETLPLNRIKQIHLGGFEKRSDYLLDAHNSPIADDVWQLYRQTLALTGPVPTLIEWDNDLPGFSRLLQEKQKANSILEEYSHSEYLSSLTTY